MNSKVFYRLKSLDIAKQLNKVNNILVHEKRSIKSVF